MKIRMQKKVSPRYILPGDVLTISEDKTDEYGNVISKQVFVSDEIKRNMVVNEIVTFDVEKGDFWDDVVDGIGGAFLNRHKQI